MAAARIDQLGIDLIGDQNDVMLHCEGCDFADHVGWGDSPGRVVGRNHHKHPRARRDAFFDLVHIKGEVVFFIGGHGNGRAAAQMNRRVISGKARRCDQHFIACRNQPQHA